MSPRPLIRSLLIEYDSVTWFFYFEEEFRRILEQLGAPQDEAFPPSSCLAEDCEGIIRQHAKYQLVKLFDLG